MVLTITSTETKIDTVTFTLKKNWNGVNTMEDKIMKAEDWIDVIDRLPSNSRTVLVCTDKGRLHLAQLYRSEWLIRGFGKVNRVTHWMEIVKPNNS